MRYVRDVSYVDARGSGVTLCVSTRATRSRNYRRDFVHYLAGVLRDARRSRSQNALGRGSCNRRAHERARTRVPDVRSRARRRDAAVDEGQ
jgi:hypothetical protein